MSSRPWRYPHLYQGSIAPFSAEEVVEEEAPLLGVPQPAVVVAYDRAVLLPFLEGNMLAEEVVVDNN